MKKDEIFISRKFKEKITLQNTEEQKKIKANHNLMKLKAQTEILENKTTHYITKYQELIISSSCRAMSTDVSTLSRHPSLSFIATGKSSGLHPVSSQSCCMYVRAGRPAFARPCEGVHRSTSLMRSSLLLQQCPTCLVRLTLIVFVLGGRWLYSWCFVGCCLQDLFNIARSILV